MWGTHLFSDDLEYIVIVMLALLSDNDEGACLERASEAATPNGINSSSRSTHAPR